MPLALMASEYANGTAMLLVATLSAALIVFVARGWTLAVPLLAAASVFALSLDMDLYSRVPEDLQAGIFLGACLGIVFGGLLLLARRVGERVYEQRRS
jgi:hypothetical protein